MIENHLYPLTSGKLSIKKTIGYYLIRDRQSKKDLSANKDLATLLLNCTGEMTILEISKKIAQEKELEENNILKSVFSMLQKLKKDEIISFSQEKKYVPIRYRETPFNFSLNTVYIEPTKKCNFSCIHCFAGSPSFTKEFDKEKELSFQEYSDLIFPKLDEFGVMGICVTGGEPFLRKDTLDILELTDKYNIELGILSNGSFFDKETVEKVKDLSPKFIGVSFDSHNEEIFSKIRGSNKYKRVLNGIKNLVEAGLDPNINCILFEGVNNTYDHITSYLNFIKEIGINPGKITFDELVPEGEGKKLQQFLINEKETILNIKKAYKKVLDIDFSMMKKPEYIGNEKKTSFCGLGEEVVYINSKGDISLCPALTGKHYTVGNILKDDLKEVWENSNLFNYFRSNEYLKGSECSLCSSLEECVGGCRAKSNTFYGDFKSKDPWLCAFYKTLN